MHIVVVFLCKSLKDYRLIKIVWLQYFIVSTRGRLPPQNSSIAHSRLFKNSQFILFILEKNALISTPLKFSPPFSCR